MCLTSSIICKCIYFFASNNFSMCFDLLYCWFLVGLVNLVHYVCDK